MEKLLFKSTIASLISSITVELFGLSVNLITYRLFGDLLLAKQLYGGEWEGKLGFGLLLNRVYPFVTDNQSVMKYTQWLAFDANSLISTLMTVFSIAFIIFFFIFYITKRHCKDKKDELPDKN